MCRCRPQFIFETEGPDTKTSTRTQTHRRRGGRERETCHSVSTLELCGESAQQYFRLCSSDGPSLTASENSLTATVHKLPVLGKSFPPFKCWCQLHRLSVSSSFPPGTEFASSLLFRLSCQNCAICKERRKDQYCFLR